VTLKVRIPFRNILIFAFLALHGVVGKALEMGIEKAERRRAAREGVTRLTKESTPAKPIATTSTNTKSSLATTLKRPREDEPAELLTPAQTPKCQWKADDGLEVRHPRQPTVSPITPRAAPPQPDRSIPRNLLANLKFGLRKRGPAQRKS
jgi:hypothetical protein